MRAFLYLALFFPFFSFAQFVPDSMGHVGDPRFKTFLKTNNVQLCGAFRKATAGNGKTFWFARIVKDSVAAYMDPNGKIYKDRIEVRKALGKDDGPHERNDVRISVEDIPAPPKPDEPDRLYNIDHGHSRKFEENGKVGYIYNGKTILPAVYDEIRVVLYTEQPLIIVTQNGKKGVADTTGKILVQPQYDYIDRTGRADSRKLYYHVKNGDKEGFLDVNGVVSIPLQPYKMSYRQTYIELSEGSQPNIYYGWMDTTGKVIVQPAFRQVSPVTEYQTGGKTRLHDAIVVTSGNRPKQKKGLMDFKGNMLLDTVYSDVTLFRGHLYSYSLEKAGKTVTGIYDVSAKKTVLPAEYSIDEYLFEDTITISRTVRDETLYGLMSGEGKVLIPADYTYLYYIRGRQLVILGNASGYTLTDMNRRPVIAQSFEELKPLRRSLNAKTLPSDQFVVKVKGRYGTMDLKGHMLIPAEYDQISPNSFGILGQKGAETVFLYPNGRVIFTTDLSVAQFDDGLFEPRIPGKIAYADLYGNVFQGKKLRW